jgi:hypothetical protein
MKFIPLLTLLVISLNVFASFEDPKTFCSETGACTSKMLEITSNYSEGNADFSRKTPMAMSGACYHLSPTYYPEREHHGGFLFERQGKDLMSTGIFSFFSDTDPYRNMSYDEMKADLAKTSAPFSKTIEKHDQVELQYLTHRSDLHYWFRSSLDGKKVYMISKQAIEEYLGFIFCDFDVH